MSFQVFLLTLSLSVFINTLSAQTLAQVNLKKTPAQDANIRQTNDDDVILVQMDPKVPYVKTQTYLKKFDLKTVRVSHQQEASLDELDDMGAAGEAPYKESSCFMPTMKLIYKDYTYVISTYCASAVKFKNQKPFEPSAEMMTNDFVFCDAVVDALEKAQAKYLKTDNLANYKYFTAKFPAPASVDSDDKDDDNTSADASDNTDIDDKDDDLGFDSDEINTVSDDELHDSGLDDDMEDIEDNFDF